MSWVIRRLTGDTQAVTCVCMPPPHLGTHGKQNTQGHSPWGCAVNTLFKGILVKISYKICLLHKVSRVLGVNSKCAQGILPSDFKKRRTFAWGTWLPPDRPFWKIYAVFISDHCQCFHTNDSPSPAALAPHSLSTLLPLRKRRQLTPLYIPSKSVCTAWLLTCFPPVSQGSSCFCSPLKHPHFLELLFWEAWPCFLLPPANFSCVLSPSCHHQAPIGSPGLCTGLCSSSYWKNCTKLGTSLHIS